MKHDCVVASFQWEKQPEFPMGEIPMGQTGCQKKQKVDIVNNDQTEAKVNRHVNHIGKPQRGVKLGTRVAQKCLE